MGARCFVSSDTSLQVAFSIVTTGGNTKAIGNSRSLLSRSDVLSLLAAGKCLAHAFLVQ